MRTIKYSVRINPNILPDPELSDKLKQRLSDMVEEHWKDSVNYAFFKSATNPCGEEPKDNANTITLGKDAYSIISQEKDLVDENSVMVKVITS